MTKTIKIKRALHCCVSVVFTVSQQLINVFISIQEKKNKENERNAIGIPFPK